MMTMEEFKDKFSTDAMREKVYAWLDTVEGSPAKHKANIILGALLNGTNAVTGIRQISDSGVTAFTANVVAGLGLDSLMMLSNLGGVAQVFADEINSLSDELKNPNIEGIPIHADVEQESTTVDVSRQMLIRETASQRTYAIDNAVPQLREWTIQGTLMAQPSLDSKLIIKPSLIMQRGLLQTFADSRRPVWYKTHDNRFFKVLIEKFESNYDVKATNALFVRLQLIEFKPLEIESAPLATRIMEIVDDPIAGPQLP